MKGRWSWLACGLAFAVTLAIVVGQRLSAEAMAVVIGVIAGVAASIPTSLLVVWFTTRTGVTTRTIVEMPAPRERERAAEPPEPRIVVMAPPPPASAGAYQNYGGYVPQAYANQGMAPGYALPPALPARRFTVVGGTEVSVEPGYGEDGPWQH